MALARVVTFEGVDSTRMTELVNNIESGEAPEGMPAAELLILHDAAGEKALAVLIVDNEDDYATAHAVMEAMPTDNTPGNRSSVTKYSVATRMTN